MSSVPPLTTDNPPAVQCVGLIAGWGDYPLVVARKLKLLGYRVIGVGIRGHADAELAELCDAYTTVNPARGGKGIRFFKRHNVKYVMMAGKVQKLILFRKFAWLRLIPDLTTLKMFYNHFVARNSDTRDDAFLLAFVAMFQRQGLTVVPATYFAPELLVKPGNLTKNTITASQQRDIDFGWELAKCMGGLDVGQTVVVKDRAVLAVEAIEGTDCCIVRAGDLCPQGGFTVVKVAKPQQDSRFDVPTVGIGTLESIVKAGGRCLAVEAEHTIIIDEPAVLQYANENNLIFVAVAGEDLIPRREAA